MHSLPILNQIAAKKSLLMSKIKTESDGDKKWEKYFF